ncbi:MAG TPA: 2-oxoacid:acceptor oxidoreductase subunit alpha [Acidimicrobiia bacterium]|nr:2-oxoacid:acceptor oxidoreductase subunit alpha [Acidimicrobiia bacterium]
MTTTRETHLVELDDLTIAVAGQGGDGSLTVANLLGNVLAARGFQLYLHRNVGSRIKGGHAAATTRATRVPRGCLGDHIDLLVAFDTEAIEKLGPSVRPGGTIVFDSSGGEIEAPEGVTVLSVMFARHAVRELRRDLFKNSIAFGLAARVLGLGDQEAIDALRTGLIRLAPPVIEANVKALAAGFDEADEAGFGSGPEPEAPETDDRVLVSGNDATAMGFAAAGGRFFAGYPITPASEILDWCEKHLPALGGVALQAEDELAAINMCLGASLGGTRAMTSTSGPGIALMQEAISHAGAAEVPVVIVDCQRAGPSTGMPTKVEQSDIGMLVYGGNGDFPRLVLAPSDPYEAFEIAVMAVELAERMQGPVFIALDQPLSQNAYTVSPLPLDKVQEFAHTIDAETVAAMPEYRRYAVTESGISPWAPFGTPGGMSLVTGNEHDEWGKVWVRPDNRIAQVDKRLRKVTTLTPDLPRGVVTGEGDVGIIAVGSAASPAREALERLSADGVEASVFQPRTVWPVLDDVRDFVESHEHVFVVEHSATAQLRAVLASVGIPLDRLHPLIRYDGLPFTAGGIATAISEEVRR